MELPFEKLSNFSFKDNNSFKINKHSSNINFHPNTYNINIINVNTIKSSKKNTNKEKAKQTTSTSINFDKNSVNNDAKSSYSIKSNSSSNTIRSMLDSIQNKNSGELSFQKMNHIKVPLEKLNSSGITQDGKSTSKYLSTNNSFNNNELKKKYSYEINLENHTIHNIKIEQAIKQKIEKANVNEEILLPPHDLCLNSLNITKPIRIKGQQNSCLIINDGPILIDLEEFNNNTGINILNNNSNNNNIIKFSQLRIIYKDNKKIKENQIASLFKLHPNSFLQLEDCDIVFQNKKNKPITSAHTQFDDYNIKSVAFCLSSNAKNENIYSQFNPTNLILSNTRIQNFYQSIRAGKNCKISINKSAFLQNYGKAIVMINPILIKVNESLFEFNGDKTIHVKYNEESLCGEKRKIFINQNEFQTTMGNCLCIEGIIDKKSDISITITNNNFHNNSTDGVLLYNIIYNCFDISGNRFSKNQGNGLKIEKSFYNAVFPYNNKDMVYLPIRIKDNQFIENKGFGLFINDCIFEAISNKFTLNRQSGMSLCEMSMDGPMINYSIEQFTKNIRKSSIILKNTFFENEASGLLIHEYPYIVDIRESVFISNCRHGIEVNLSNLYKKKFGDILSLIKDFKSGDIKKSYELSSIRLNKCVLEKNWKTGISINSCFIYCDETIITNNIEYAIYTKKKEYQYCLRDGRKNGITGGIGGDWGQIEFGEGDSCGFACIGCNSKIDTKIKDEIIKKAPSFLSKNSSSYEDKDGKNNKNNEHNDKNKNDAGDRCNIF